MAWHISNIDNTVKITEECYRELEIIAEEEYFYIEAYNPANPEFPLMSDNMEFMDVISNKRVQELLLKYKVNGIITFADFDGYEKKLWGYSFLHGICTKLKGVIGWFNAS